jgi:uncharacterized lipoprotein YehR (DUF1307 family)
MRTFKSIPALIAIALGLSLMLTACGGDKESKFNKSEAAKAGETVVKGYINATVDQDAKKACSLMSAAAQNRALEQGIEQKMWKEGSTCEEAMKIGFKTRQVTDETREMVKSLTYKATDVTAKGMVVRLSSAQDPSLSVGYKLVPKGDGWVIEDLATSGAASPSASPSK